MCTVQCSALHYNLINLNTDGMLMMMKERFIMEHYSRVEKFLKTKILDSLKIFSTTHKRNELDLKCFNPLFAVLLSGIWKMIL